MNRVLTNLTLKQLLYAKKVHPNNYCGHVRECRRFFSDNLLGYSPMSPKQVVNNQPDSKKNPSDAPSSPGGVGPSWGVDANTAGGGVWANTSAKKDKILELKAELTDEQEILDDAATHAQLRDLHLADGIRLVARAVDECWGEQQLNGSTNLISLEFLQENSTDNLNKVTFEAYMNQIIRFLQQSKTPAELESLRIFAESNTDDKVAFSSSVSAVEIEDAPDDSGSTVPRTLETDFDGCTKFYRSLLVCAAAAHLLSNWDNITSKTSSDIDRAAVRDDADFETSVNVLPQSDINQVIKAFAEGNCLNRIEALWRLIDHDKDGLIDQEEMEKVIYLSIAPIGEALKTFVEAAIETNPMLIETSENSGWRQRRRERKTQKAFKRMFSKSVERHFDIEVEMSHRLRCLYAWADKAHQGGKIDSVLIESGTIAGRKRYVELNPKISFEEFCVTKGEIFPHLDRVSEEIVSSFREDLLVAQGKGRQNRELMRDCVVGVTIISILDAIIQTL